MTRKPCFAITQTMRVCIVVAFVGLFASGCRKEDESGLVPQVSPPASDLPCEVEKVFAARCWACHGRTPTAGAPSLTSVAELTAMSKLDRTQSEAAVAGSPCACSGEQ